VRLQRDGGWRGHGDRGGRKPPGGDQVVVGWFATRSALRVRKIAPSPGPRGDQGSTADHHQPIEFACAPGRLTAAGGHSRVADDLIRSEERGLGRSSHAGGSVAFCTSRRRLVADRRVATSITVDSPTCSTRRRMSRCRLIPRVRIPVWQHRREGLRRGRRCLRNMR